MRTPLSQQQASDGVVVGKETVGDYVRLELLTTTVSEASSSSITSLAQLNRILVSKPVDASKYAQECLWFVDFNKFQEIGRPNSDFLTDKHSIVVTNWSSFPYEDIRFDDAVACELLVEPSHHATATGCFVKVLFKGLGESRKISAIISTLYPELIESFRQLESQESGLFSILE
jgi:hypothetical protein